MMPVDLVLVRHGESEGNLARKRSKRGDSSAFTDAFKARHSSRFRLTSRGEEQAQSAGNWIKDNLDENFDLYYVSEYIRAMETAALLDLPGAQWDQQIYLRERDRGDMDVLSEEEAANMFAHSLKGKERDSFYWKPPGGESLADLCLRVDRVLNKLHRETDKRISLGQKRPKAIVVCHGEVIQAFRIRLEHIPQRRFLELDKSKEWGKVENCQIIHYSRVDPVSGKLYDKMKFVRSICPWDMQRSKNDWQEITFQKYTNQDLLQEVLSEERLVDRSGIEH